MSEEDAAHGQLVLALAALRCSDLLGGQGPSDLGGGGLAVRLRRFKTDQTGTTVTVGFTAVDPLPDGIPDPLDAGVLTTWGVHPSGLSYPRLRDQASGAG